MAIHLSNENVWFDQYKFMDAERDYYSKLAQKMGGGDSNQRSTSPLIEQISLARQQIHQSLAAPVTHKQKGSGDAALVDLTSRINRLELENSELKQITNDLKNMLTKLSSRIDQMENTSAPVVVKPAAPVVAPAPPVKTEPAKEEEADDDDDDDFDMFGSDEEEEVDEEAERIKNERLAAYAVKKAGKAVVIAKSSVLLDVKPWDDETDMAEMQRLVRTIIKDGLVWGQGQLKPVGYGINKLVINCIVEDDKVSIEELSEEIEGFEEYVQSVDVAAFNKI